MSISPETLVEEGDSERREREGRTGVYRNGLVVLCRPDPSDPEVYRRQHRAACISHPYPTCPSCVHGRFTLFFDGNPTSGFQVVQCPKWGSTSKRVRGDMPTSYEVTELSTCASKPFEFCPSCPSQNELVQIGADKQVAGWYGRWDRIRQEEFENHD